ncbi:hypothetical protein ABG067_001247 [Albugo candida]
MTFVGSPLSPKDPDGYNKVFQFKLLTNENSPIFAIGVDSGQVFVSGGSGSDSVLDYERKNQYSYQISVTEEGEERATYCSLIIDILDVNEAPDFSVIISNPIYENLIGGTIIMNIIGVDPENQTLSFSHRSTLGDGNEDAFRITPTSYTSANLELLHGSLDYENQSVFDICVTVTDYEYSNTNLAIHGPTGLSSTQTFNIQLTDVNEPPKLRNATRIPNRVTLSIPENSPFGSVVSLQGLNSYFYDPDKNDQLTFRIISSLPRAGMFAINRTSSNDAILTVLDSSLLDHEEVSTAFLDLYVVDLDSNSISWELEVQIADVNEAPYFSPSTLKLSVLQNISSTEVITYFSAIDPENRGSRILYDIIWSSHPMQFSIRDMRCLRRTNISNSSTSLKQDVYRLQIVAVDEYGAGKSSTNVLMVEIIAVARGEPPLLASFTLNVSEDVLPGSKVGTVDAKMRIDSVLNFSLVPHSKRFILQSIDALSADVVFIGSTSNYQFGLDHEAEPTIEFKICATDMLSYMEACSKLLIKVDDVNEAPLMDANSCRLLREVEESYCSWDSEEFKAPGGYFDGNTSFDLGSLMHEGSIVFGTNLDYTLSVAIYPESDGYSNIYELRHANENSMDSLFLNLSVLRNNAISLIIVEPQSTLSIITAPVVALREWAHITVIITFADRSARIYVNENLVGTNTSSLLNDYTAYSQKWITSSSAVLSSSSRPFHGWITRFQYVGATIAVPEQLAQLITYPGRMILFPLHSPSDQFCMIIVTKFYAEPTMINATLRELHDYCTKQGLHFCEPWGYLQNSIPTDEKNSAFGDHFWRTSIISESITCCSYPKQIALVGSSNSALLQASTIDASSYLGNRKEHGYGHYGLDFVRIGAENNITHSWCSGSNTSNDPANYIEFSLPASTMIDTITIASGFNSITGVSSTVTEFKLWYRSSSTSPFTPYDPGRAHCFGWKSSEAFASTESDYIMTRGAYSGMSSYNVSVQNIIAVQLRIYPISWTGDAACLKIEIYSPLTILNLQHKVRAIDQDAEYGEDKLIFQLDESTRALPFFIDQNTGQLGYIKNWINRQSDSDFRLNVTATDSHGLTDSCIVDVNVRSAYKSPGKTEPGLIFRINENPLSGEHIAYYHPVLSNAKDKVAVYIRNRISSETQAPCPFVFDNVSHALRVRDPKLFDFERHPVLKCQVLLINDAQFPLSSLQTVSVTVLDMNEPPLIPPNQHGYIAENATAGTAIMVVNCVDPDANKTTMLANSSWSKLQFYLVNSTIFAIDLSSGVLSLRSSFSLNYESQREFILNVMVTDGGFLTTEGTVYVSILDVVESPIVNPSITVSVSENGLVPRNLFAINATDPDSVSSQLLRYSVINACAGNSISIGYATGLLQLNSPLDFEQTPKYQCKLQIYKILETGEKLSSVSDVIIDVEDINEAPVLDTVTPIVFQIEEGMTSGNTIGAALSTYVSDPENDTITYRLESSYWSSFFDLDACHGQLRSRDPFDYEANYIGGIYLSVLATEILETGEKLSSVSDVIIDVEDINEAPVLDTVTPIVFQIEEGMTSGNTIGAALSTYVSDPENDTITYRLESSYWSSFFDLDACHGQLRSRDPFDYEANYIGGIYLSVLATEVRTKNHLATSINVSLHILDINEPPVFYAPRYTFSIPENGSNKTFVGNLDAMDPDRNDILKFTIVQAGPSTVPFQVDAWSGEVSLPNNTHLDYERVSSYIFIVQVTDKMRLSASTEVTINIIDLNEAPYCANVAYVPFSEDAPIGARSTGILKAIDPDKADEGQMIFYRFREENGVFAIDKDLVMVNAELDYETFPSYALLL